MPGVRVAERQRRIISRVANVEDAALLERIERMLEEHLSRPTLVPLREDDVDKILQRLLDGD
jgi:hypothetical protein